MSNVNRQKTCEKKFTIIEPFIVTRIASPRSVVLKNTFTMDGSYFGGVNGN
jgi:hypothetical protein